MANESPAANLAAQLLVESALVTQGKLVVAVRANRSASTVTRPGEANPLFYHIPTSRGVKKFRMGDRWPDPEVYVNYPSSQMLAYMDIGNLKCTWPGKEDGAITEKTCYAFYKVIEEKKVDVFIDYHEPEPESPVISTILTHQKMTEAAVMGRHYAYR
ncbi:hypothetical protein [Dethiosulfatarculus sandiegensis]|uniref:hypothetical protein n=1 Tax=Dethiosulfatarculus sandiegensis TaxID=1429043 RepID=UPI0006960025|nr:hypothetical protein [Dethiosulfatarculus sandiegensis]